MGIAITLLTVIFVVVCLLMTLVVMMQRPKQEGLGAAFGGGMMGDAFGSQATNVLQKATVWFAVLYFVIALALAVLMARQHSPNASFESGMEKAGAAPTSQALPSDAGAAPAVSAPTIEGATEVEAMETPAGDILETETEVIETSNGAVLKTDSEVTETVGDILKTEPEVMETPVPTESEDASAPVGQ